MDRITSTNSSLVKKVRELERKGKARRESGLFIAEGERLCSEIPPAFLERLFLSEDYHGRLPAISLGDSRILRVSPSVMEYMSDTEHPQGILAMVRMPEYPEMEGDLFLLLENLQDPGNLGTIFRTAEAAGASGIFLSRGCVDLFSPKAVRSTMGSLFRIPFQLVPDLIETARALKNRGIEIYAAHLDGVKPHYDFDYRRPSAFLIGNEGNGLSEELTAEADQLIRIPMKGRTESLNASVSAALLLYEALRQRETSKL